MLQAQAARGLKWQIIEIGGRYLVSLFVFTAMARLLDATSFGLIALVGVYLSLVQMIGEGGLATALIQRAQLDRDHLNTAFWFVCGTSCLLCGSTIVLAAPLAGLFHEPKLAPLLMWASLSLVINASGTIQGALFLKELDLRRPAIRTLIANAIAGVVGVGMALGGWGVWALIGQQMAASLSGAVFLWLVSPWRPQFRFSVSHLKELLGIGGAVTFTTLIRVVSSRADQVCIARVLGPAVLGQYTIAGKLVELMCAALYQPITAISLPSLAKLQHDRPRFVKAVYKAMSLNAMVSFPAMVGVAVVAGDVVPLVFGKQWQPAAPILRVFSIYILVQGLQIFFHPMLLALGKPGAYLALNSVLAAGSVIACLIGVKFGVLAVLAGLIVNATLVGGLTFAFLARQMELSVVSFWKPCVWPAVAAGLMAAGTWIVRAELPPPTAPWIALIAQIAVGGVIYCGIVSLFARGDVELLWDFSRQVATRSGNLSSGDFPAALYGESPDRTPAAIAG